MEVVLILLWLFGVLTFILALIAAFVSKLRGGKVGVFLRNAAISFVGSIATFISFGFVVSSDSPPEVDSVEMETESPSRKVDRMEETESAETTTGSEFEDALASAETYLEHTSFSKKGLYEQLLFEAYSEEAAQHAVENVQTDWNENALLTAQERLKYSGFSEQGLYDQLVFEGFTAEQVQYAMDNITADWNEEALQSALQYLEHTSLTGQDLYEQLLYEEFTEEQAQYAMDNLPE